MRAAAAVEQRIAVAEAERDVLAAQIADLEAGARAAMAAEPPDEERAEAAQRQRDDVGRRLERVRLQLEALEGRRPEADRSDAEAEVAELQPRHDTLREGIAEGLGRVREALGALEAAVGELVGTAERLHHARERLHELAQHGVAVDVAPEPTIGQIGNTDPRTPPELRLVKRALDVHHAALAGLERAAKLSR